MAIIRSHSGKELLDTAEALIIVQVESTECHEFELVKTEMRHHCPILEMETPCYVLQPATSPKNYHKNFYAYFCSYEADKLRTVRIGQSMDYFFTASLSGCSVGIGLPDSLGRQWIGHANAMSAGENIGAMLAGAPVSTFQTVQQKFQKMMLKYANKGPLQVHHQQDYGIPVGTDAPMRTTLIGFRDKGSGKWSFIRQTYNVENLS